MKMFSRLLLGVLFIAVNAAAQVNVQGTGIQIGGSPSAGSSFPNTNGVVYNTSTIASRNANSADFAAIMQAATNCTNAAYVYSPQSNTCITFAPSSGSANYAPATGSTAYLQTAASGTQTVNQPPNAGLLFNLGANAGFVLGHHGTSSGIVLDAFDHTNIMSAQGYSLGVNAASSTGYNCVFFVAPNGTYNCVGDTGFSGVNWLYVDAAGKSWGWNGSANKAFCLQDGTYCPPSGSTIATQTNGVNNASQTTLNETNSTANTAGFSVTASNPSGGTVVHEVGVSNAATARAALGAAAAASPITLNGNPALTGSLYTSSNLVYMPSARICLGDSITYGYSLSSPTTQRYCSLTSAALNQTLSDYAISGDQSADIFPRQITPGSYQVLAQLDNNALSSAMIGTNDADVKGTGAYETAVFKPTHQAVEAWTLTPRPLMVLPGDSGMTATGSCVATSGTLATNSNGSTVVGAACTGAGTQTISLPTYGAPIYGWYLVYDGASGNPAFTVMVDGVSTGVTYYTKPSVAISTQNGTTASVALIRITGIAAGTHSIVVTTTTGGIGTVGWGTPKNANIYLGHPAFMSHDIPNQAQSGGLATPATIAAYNADVLADDGLFLTDSLDLRHVYNQKCMLGTAAEMNDQVHPNVSGHVHLSQCEIPVAIQNPVPRNYSNEGSGIMPPGVTQTVGSGANISLSTGGTLTSTGGSVCLGCAAPAIPLFLQQITADPNGGLMLQGNSTYANYSASVAFRENTTAGSSTPASRFSNLYSKNGGHLTLGSQSGYGSGYYTAWDIDLTPTAPAPGLFQYYGPFQATTINGAAISATGSASAYLNGAGGYTTPPGFANPMTTLGDTIYGGTSGAATRLAGNTSTTPCVIRETGTGSAAQAPACDPAPAISAANMTNVPAPSFSSYLTGSPSLALGSAAQSGTSVTALIGANISGIIEFLTGSGYDSGGTYATLTFSPALGYTPKSCTLSSRNSNFGATVMWADSATSTGFAIRSNGGVRGGTYYDLAYQCL